MLKLTSSTSPSGWNVSLSTGLTVLAAVGLASLFGWALAREYWLITASLGLVALIPVFIRWPVVCTLGIYAFLVCSFDSLPLFQGVATLSRPAGALAGGVLIIAGLMERRLGRPPAAALWWGLFVLWGVLTLAWAEELELPLRRLPSILSMFVLYLVTICFRPTRRELYAVCVLTVLGGAMAASVGYFFGLEGAEMGRGRVVIGDMESNPNSLGRMLILPLALAIAGFVGLRGIAKKAMAMGCLGVIGVGMFISMSRAAVLAMMVVIVVLLYRMQSRKQIVVAAAILAALTVVVPEKFFERMGEVVTGEDATGSGRTEIWQTGLNALDQFWLFGAGLYNFHTITGGAGAHNSLLMVTLELGVVGLALMLMAVGSHFFAVRRARTAGYGSLPLAALEAAAFGMLTGAIFADRIWTKTFWLTWALLVWAIQCGRTPGEVPEGKQVGVHGAASPLSARRV